MTVAKFLGKLMSASENIDMMEHVSFKSAGS